MAHPDIRGPLSRSAAMEMSDSKLDLKCNPNVSHEGTESGDEDSNCKVNGSNCQLPNEPRTVVDLTVKGCQECPNVDILDGCSKEDIAPNSMTPMNNSPESETNQWNGDTKLTAVRELCNHRGPMENGQVCNSGPSGDECSNDVPKQQPNHEGKHTVTVSVYCNCMYILWLMLLLDIPRRLSLRTRQFFSSYFHDRSMKN